MFGNFTFQPDAPADAERNGFLALAEFDGPAGAGNGGLGGNSDGVIDSADAVFADLRLWQDANHDGVSQPGELHALPSRGVEKISLGYKESRRTDGHGNLFRYRSKVDGAEGGEAGRWAWDVFLASQ